MLELGVDSARGFVRLWLGLTLGVLTYAWLDLRMNPRLTTETRFSMRPNLEQAWDLLHWGGRLLNHGALYMLVGNAIVLSGMAALVLRSGVRWLSRRRRPGIERRVSIVPGPAPTSVRPPHA
jgi:hypothetical protein